MLLLLKQLELFAYAAIFESRTRSLYILTQLRVIMTQDVLDVGLVYGLWVQCLRFMIFFTRIPKENWGMSKLLSKCPNPTKCLDWTPFYTYRYRQLLNIAHYSMWPVCLLF